VDFSVLIITRDRADMLRATLESLAAMVTSASWQVVVVDNGSSDATPCAVRETAARFPVPLSYVFDATPGKYGALNRAIRACASTYIAATDDDAIVPGDWLSQAYAGLTTLNVDFVGGRVLPRWSAPPPAWLRAGNAAFDKVIALQDHGNRVREYGKGISWPLGVNVAYRRDVFDRVGYFDDSLGRTAGTLRNQAQREWHLRARTAGVVGTYLPEMRVYHRVGTDRLSPHYFRRWYYWHGISRAMLTARLGTDLEEPEQPVERRSDVLLPWSMWRRSARTGAAICWRILRGRRADTLEQQLYLCFVAGVLRERLRRPAVSAAPAEIAEPREVQPQTGQPAH
jgi:glycosyltransferase involved in cell wall biosynthesis